MNRTLLPALLFGGLLIGFHVHQAPSTDRFAVPEGFAVEEVYAPDLAGSVVAMTFDSQGRLVLAREDSFVVTLYQGADGAFEERIFSDRIREAQGILFDGPDLLAVGNGPDSVAMYRVVDVDGDSRGDRVEVVARVTGEMGDHGPHQPVFGSDGYLYWSLGNFTALYEATSPVSPVRSYKDANLEVARTNGFGADTRAPGAIIVRKDLEDPGSDWDLVTIGMRNHYDAAFNALGELFTYDSDMEWDRDLPWFRETRSIHLVPGGDYGWRTGNMKHPAYYIDDLPPMEDVGRGSPVGVTFYQSHSYPSDYWDVFLQGDWSRGRIIMGRLAKHGATYLQDSSQDFVFGTPLNVTDLEVGPDGNVYFALGGRDTDGGVYRVVYTGAESPQPVQSESLLDSALTLPQLRSAWSRQTALDLKQRLGDGAWQQGLTAVIRDVEDSPDLRVRAMELLHVFGPGLDDNTLIRLGEDASWQVRAASAYYLGTRTGRGARNAQRELARRLQDTDPFVQRRAAEALLRTGIHPSADVPVSALADVFPLLASPDRFVRYAGRNLLRELNRNGWQEAALAADGFPQAPEALMALVQSIHSPYMKDLERIVERQLELLHMRPVGDDLLALLRTMQRTMLEDHGVNLGARPFFRRGNDDQPARGYEGIGKELLEVFPSGDWRVDRELARILAYLEPPGTASALAAELGAVHNDRLQQIAYADALSFVESGWEAESIDGMVSWLETVYAEEWKGGRQFRSYINLMRDGFLGSIPDSSRADASARIEASQPQLAAAAQQGFGRRLGLSPISDQELEEELVFNPANFEGDFDEGAWAYEKALCSACHTFGPIGVEFGPDLTTVNQRFNRQDLVAAIMRPSETVSDLWQVEQITRSDGTVVAGTVYNEDAGNLYLQIPAGPQLTIPKSEIASRELSEVSSMPADLLRNLSGGEQRALLLLLEAGPQAIPDSALNRIGAGG